MGTPSPVSIRKYLGSRPPRVRALEWLCGRRYRVVEVARPWVAPEEALPIVIAHSRRDSSAAQSLVEGLESDWPSVPTSCRQAYESILDCAPGIVIVDLRRTNRCGCLGHRHPVVREGPFTEPHEALGGQVAGELDIAWQRVEAWPALPLEEAALHARFFEGSRLNEFRARQFRLRLLSVFLHETNHLAFPHEPEESVRDRSLAFYRDALRNYVEEACGTLSFTIDRSFSRLE
jgi:hypothetical protein